jgi:Zn-finger nucleic acid-binding protein
MCNSSHAHDIEKKDTRLRCPKDGTLMQKELVAGQVTIDRCAHCGCLWLDKGELEKLIALVTDEAVQTVEADVERSRKAGRTYGEDGDDDDFDDHRRRGGKRRSRFMDIFD